MTDGIAVPETNPSENFDLSESEIITSAQSVPRQTWHPINCARDAVQPREWALYLFLQALAMAPQDDRQCLWADITISHRELCQKIYMHKCGLQRSLRRLCALRFIAVLDRGKSRQQATTYRVYSMCAIDDAVRHSQCTHYVMQGGRRKLLRVDVHL